jgi:hypothetical protein
LTELAAISVRTAQRRDKPAKNPSTAPTKNPLPESWANKLPNSAPQTEPHKMIIAHS